MKRLITILFLAASLTGWGQVVTVDSYPESNHAVDGGVNNGSYTQRGQSFTVSYNVRLDSCKFYVKKQGSPTGNLTCYIYAHSGTYGTSSVPTGTALATSGTVDISTLGTSYALKNFAFTGVNSILLTTGYYVITIQYTGGDNSNRIVISADNTSPSHSGNLIRYQSIWEATTNDNIFYVYGVPEIKKIAGIAATSTKNVAGVADASIKKISGKTK